MNEIQEIPGSVVVFMIGQSCMNLEANEVVEIKAIRSAPSYLDVIPKQKVIKQESRNVDGQEVGFLVKAYLPDVLVVEASVSVADILADSTLEFKRRLVTECRKILAEYVCNRDFDEEYSVYCISGYQGEPEVFLSLFSEKIVAFLKNENEPLDEEEVSATLAPDRLISPISVK